MFDEHTLTKLFPIALTLSLIAYLEAISIAKSLEPKHPEYKVIPNQELIALVILLVLFSKHILQQRVFLEQRLMRSQKQRPLYLH